MKTDYPEVCDNSHCKACPFLEQVMNLLEKAKENTAHFPPEDDQRSNNMWY